MRNWCTVRKTLPKFSERVLTSTKILAQRSAVPAVFSRATSSSASTSTKPEKRKVVSHDEKGRLLRMGKKLRRGPFDAYVDPDQVGEGSAMLELSEAAKKAGSYDIWDEEVSEGISVKVRPTSLFPSRISEAQTPYPPMVLHAHVWVVRCLGTTNTTSAHSHLPGGRTLTARGVILQPPTDVPRGSSPRGERRGGAEAEGRRRARSDEGEDGERSPHRIRRGSRSHRCGHRPGNDSAGGGGSGGGGRGAGTGGWRGPAASEEDAREKDEATEEEGGEAACGSASFVPSFPCVRC